MKKRNLYISFLFITLLLLISCSNNNNPVGVDYSSPWTTSTPETQNVDSKYLNDLVTQINDNTFGNVQSLVILRNDNLIFEKYFRGYARETLHHVYSVTKSFTSAMVGIAIQQGIISGINEKLMNYFKDYNIQNSDTSKSSITLRNVLTMSAGFQWNELSIPYSDTNNDFNKLFASSDAIQYVLDKPMQNYPGTKFRYNTGLPLLFSFIIQEETGKSAETFTVENIFKKIGISSYKWDNAPKGITNTGSGLFLRPIDMALFGQLFLNRGVWNGEQIIRSDWVDISTANSISVNSNIDYGFYWWRYSKLNSVVNTLPVNDVYFAYGYGDQIIWVIPQYKMVVVITADNGENNFPTDNIIKNYVLPSITNK